MYLVSLRIVQFKVTVYSLEWAALWQGHYRTLAIDPIITLSNLGRPTTLGKTWRGASSPPNPHLMRPVPLSIITGGESNPVANEGI